MVYHSYMYMPYVYHPKCVSHANTYLIGVQVSKVVIINSNTECISVGNWNEFNLKKINKDSLEDKFGASGI
jgi:hypothetical protein